MTSNRAAIPLHNIFAGLTEQAFHTRLGVVDPPLVDYLVEMLVRFVRCETIYSVRDLAGRRLDQVSDMLTEAQARIGDARREVHRHVGDFVLFWTGIYPEALARRSSVGRKDELVDLRAQGKRAYYIASTIPAAEREQENRVLSRLSDQFEMCAYGLGEVRREWERIDPAGPGELLLVN